MVAMGFEPTKHYTIELKSIPFDHSGTLPLYVIMISLYSYINYCKYKKRLICFFSSLSIEKINRLSQLMSLVYL